LNANGWWRDTAQRLLVERNDRAAVPLLVKLATSGANPLGRLQALWTLQGMGEIDVDTLRKAVDDADARVASAAIRLSEPYMVTRRGHGMLDDVLRQANRPEVRLQLVLSISDQTSDKAQQALANILAASADKPLIIDAAVSGLAGRELPFLQMLLADSKWNDRAPGRASVLAVLSTCVFNSKDPDGVGELLNLAFAQKDQTAWRQAAMLDALGAVARAPGRKQKVTLKQKPDALLASEESPDKHVAERTRLIAGLLNWPGKPQEAQVEQTALTASQQKSFDRGQVVFGTVCAQCHQFDGRGMEGKAPSLIDSPLALGPDIRLIRIVLNGAKGEFHVQGWVPNQEMPTLAVLSDQQIADVLTYIRHEWDHNAPPVSMRTVGRVRAEVGDRPNAWTEPELLAISAPASATTPPTRRGTATAPAAAHR
jgi:mono/diheme cytochrome c family protein